MNLTEFLAWTDGPPNQWIREPHMNVYVRRSKRYIGNQMVDCLDLATVEVDEGHWGKGHLTKFLLRFEQEAAKLKRAVYVESILQPRLLLFLSKLGYQFVPGTEMTSPNMYKLLD